MQTLSRMEKQKKMIRKRKRRSPLRFVKRFLFFSVMWLFIMAIGGGIFLFGTDKGLELREWAAGTLLTTQHDYWAPYTFLPEDRMDKLKQEIKQPVIVNSQPTVAKPAPEPATLPEKPRELITIEEISVDKGSYNFKGKIMYISDPNRVHLVTTQRKDRGDLLDEFTKKHQALGIVNASGFYDPDGYGKGKQAFGLVISDGRILQNYNPKGGDTALAITYDGKLITGSYSAQQLIDMGVRDAMSFRPQLIVNGKNLFTDRPAQSWGIQPRTAIGQKADGTIVFVVIDGRQPGHSIGASMTDLANLLEQKGVVNAMAMDGGSSSMMLYKGEAITKTSCPYYRGRYLPNAWAVL
ncbi:phosphodiester glycosidase family protein [Brevibacillus migulae]|uniref:phosphodiester glycosidase family protein n=1 Tax=Brevibacillus migulae TaxID=1644114 RepID=UPI00106E3605|nr:phosphodiester glycosidase family protein [Brevibacillus migulae]